MLRIANITQKTYFDHMVQMSEERYPTTSYCMLLYRQVEKADRVEDLNRRSTTSKTGRDGRLEGFLKLQRLSKSMGWYIGLPLT